ncbi:MAG TPA: butyrate kinase [Spirochaetota bacterium]|jgi:butyrate kinase|nr:butyrate kinase [Spirochaetota bacterium]HOK92521.1 butyrate kinase [Spirochaetota bacterium]HON16043.1 butyrate kinase [Spirochaetota bacterium]HPD78332.1 butyrate kinase [Spirochaetota bacterium]HPP94253.1 butyrate kinase [Spirochaetota bacterium]
MRILAINPGSTSTKISVFDNQKDIFTLNIKHSIDDLCKYKSVMEQYDFRKSVIIDELNRAKIDLKTIDAVVGRGGLVKPIAGGVYRVNDLLLRDLNAEIMGSHPSNLGGILAHEISKEIGLKESFIVDPPIVDEMDEVARISGMPEITRKSIFHALNQKAVARRFARENRKHYEELNLIVAHLGGGITVGAHQKGRVIDVNNGLDGEGPFSPERSGGLPVGDLVKMCFSGEYTFEQIKKKITGQGGLVAYLGTNSAYEVSQKVAEGDIESLRIYRAMAYQVAKEIGSMAAVLKGDVDAILITGGIAYDENFCAWIEEMVSFIARVAVYPGEDEMKALAEGVFYALKGEMEIKEYE